MTWIKEDIKLREDEIKRTVHCSCSHSIVFSYKTEKKICSWCGRDVYNKNELGQKAKFRDTLKKEIKKIKEKDKEKINGRDKDKI